MFDKIQVDLYPVQGNRRDFDAHLRGGHTMEGRLSVEEVEGALWTMVYHDREDPLGHNMDIRPTGDMQDVIKNRKAKAVIRAALDS